MTTTVPTPPRGGDTTHLWLAGGDRAREQAAPRAERLPFDLLFALAVGAGLALAAAVDASDNGKLVSLLMLMLASGAASSALLRPHRFPLWLFAYLPYNTRFPFKVLGVSYLNMTTLLLGLCVVAVLASRLRRPSRLQWGVFELMVLAFVGLGALGLLRTLTLHHESSTLALLFSFKRWIAPFLFFFVVRALVESRRDVRDAVLVLCWTAVLLGAVVWFQGVQMGDRGSIERSRVGSVLGQPNSMGAFIVYYAAPLFAFFLKMKRWSLRGACLAGFLIAVRGLLFTFSRGAYLALASACAVLALLANPAYLIVAGAGAAVARLAPEVVPASVEARVADTQRRDEIYDDDLEDNLDRSSQHRLMLWRAGMAMIADHPWRGVGWHRFAGAVDEYTEEELKPGDPRDAHNAYVLVAAELGLPAFVLMLLLLAGIGASGVSLYFRKTDRFDRALALSLVGSLVGVAVSCMFGSRFTNEALISPFWMLVALLMVSRQMRPDGSLFGDQR